MTFLNGAVSLALCYEKIILKRMKVKKQLIIFFNFAHDGVMTSQLPPMFRLFN